MRKVFVYWNGNDYTVIDKSTNQIFNKIDDLMLFNAKYARYNKIKGFHGILNEEINEDVLDILSKSFIEIGFLGKKYYPRRRPFLLIETPIKTIQYLKMKPDYKLYGLILNHFLYEDRYYRSLCDPWCKQGITWDEEDWEWYEENQFPQTTNETG